jgi:ATP-dependent Clp protease ATP-binding subunit ClpX
MDDVEFTINDEALDFSRQRFRIQIRARGLRSLCEAVLTDAMYEPSSDAKTLKIDLNMQKKPRIY